MGRFGVMTLLGWVSCVPMCLLEGVATVVKVRLKCVVCVVVVVMLCVALVLLCLCCVTSRWVVSLLVWVRLCLVPVSFRVVCLVVVVVLAWLSSVRIRLVCIVLLVLISIDLIMLLTPNDSVNLLLVLTCLAVWTIVSLVVGAVWVVTIGCVVLLLGPVLMIVGVGSYVPRTRSVIVVRMRVG